MRDALPGILSGFFIVNAIVSISVIILERRRPEKTIAWLMVFVIFPPLGLFLYIFLGRNWKKHKLNSGKLRYHNDYLNYQLLQSKNLKYTTLMQLIQNNGGSPIFENNSVKIFNNGEDKFKALKEEIKQAKHHIHMEYYIVKNDDIGNEIKNLLIQKSKEGVKVKFIIDKVGSSHLKKEFTDELKENGIDVVFYSYFLAPLLKQINTQINFRNHRKIVIIDGRVGFIGGMNIGDEYLSKGKLGFWRDAHIMIKGDCVLGLQSVFIDDFYMIKKADKKEVKDFDNMKIKELDKYFPDEPSSDGKSMQLMKSGPNSPNPSIMQGVVKMLSLAKDHIYIVTPYFIPTESIMSELKVAVLSGVDVRIIFPGKYDHFYVYHASRTYLAELVKGGIKVYFYKQDSFIHSKVITIDGEIASVGTANMDIRSYELNYEINAVIYDDKVTKEFERLFFHDLKESKIATIEDFDNTPIHMKFMEGVARLFSNLL